MIEATYRAERDRPDPAIWDGLVNSYWPADGPMRALGVPAWESSEEVDDVTFEVVRHRLFRVVEEQGLTIMRASGSPVAAFAHDFSTSILTPRGEVVYFGPWNQPQVGHIDRNVKWILANRVRNPGIRPGDMFFANDPWIGANHQSDVSMVCPIFIDGKLLCWVASVIHVIDIGGTTPGGFCPDATSVYDEPVPTPPKLYVRAGEVRADAEDAVLRQSRLPDRLRLDLRSLIAANNVAIERVREIVERYDVRGVIASMERIVADSERIFRERVSKLPDGVWSRVGYLDTAGPGDRGVYPVRLRLVKDGASITFDHEGTHPQVGSLSTTAGGWRSAILSALGPLLCWDQMYAVGGAMRQVGFAPVPGSIVSASHPASVSNSSMAIPLTIALATGCISHMLAASPIPALRDRAMAPAAGTFPVAIMSGKDRADQPFASISLDPMGGGLGAFGFRDGVDTGGHLWDPVSTMPNVEYTEQYLPVLYLFRREAADSGGAGFYRGGNGGAFALTPHGVPEITVDIAAAGWAVPTSDGLLGGLPGAPNGGRVTGDDRVTQAIAAGWLPQSSVEGGRSAERLPPKARNLVVGKGVMFEMWWNAGGGLGDPFARDPELVAADVRSGAVSVEHALAAYGVTVADGGVDVEGTRAARVAAGRRSSSRSGGALPRIVQSGGGWQCPGCDAPLDEVADEGDVHLGAEATEVGLRDLCAWASPPGLFVDAAITYRIRSCGSCGRAVDGYLVVRRPDRDDRKAGSEPFQSPLLP
jgi:N-methylhydantoinase B